MAEDEENNDAGAGKVEAGNESAAKDKNDKNVPVWATILIALGTALIGALGSYLPAREKVSVERDKLKAEQQRASQLESQPGKTVQIEGRYEWQWAGEGWKGYVSVDKAGNVRTSMLRFLNCGGSVHVVPLLEQKGEAKAELIEDSTKMRVAIPVQFINYDSSCNRTGVNAVTTLAGDLDRHVAYAGKIEYRSDYGAPLGDMVLVKDYISGID